MSRQLPTLTRRVVAPVRRALERAVPHNTALRELSDITYTPSEYADRIVRSIENGSAAKRPIALIISAYNEELVLEHTIRSAMAAGLSAHDIFVVDDKSADDTAAIARRVVGPLNVLTVNRSGKGLAIHQINEALRISQRYDWIHIADADGEFDSQYFNELTAHLDPDYAAATGYVTSLPGSYISKYRGFEYALGMDVTRRFQSMADVITIVPGPTSIFRADVFEQLDFNANALCEDFDVTLQIHRQGLGKILFIESAIARTQDPGTMRDYLRQITRWNRGVMQMFFKHRIGSTASRVDTYLLYQLAQNLLFFCMYAIWIPVITLMTGSIVYLALAFLSDVIIVLGFVLFAQIRTRRRDILPAFPVVYLLRWVSLAVFIKCFVEVFLLGRHRLANGVWETVQRRVNPA